MSLSEIEQKFAKLYHDLNMPSWWLGKDQRAFLLNSLKQSRDNYSDFLKQHFDLAKSIFYYLPFKNFLITLSIVLAFIWMNVFFYSTSIIFFTIAAISFFIYTAPLIMAQIDSLGSRIESYWASSAAQPLKTELSQDWEIFAQYLHHCYPFPQEGDSLDTLERLVKALHEEQRWPSSLSRYHRSYEQSCLALVKEYRAFLEQRVKSLLDTKLQSHGWLLSLVEIGTSWDSFFAIYPHYEKFSSEYQDYLNIQRVRASQPVQTDYLFRDFFRLHLHDWNWDVGSGENSRPLPQISSYLRLSFCKSLQEFFAKDQKNCADVGLDEATMQKIITGVPVDITCESSYWTSELIQSLRYHHQNHLMTSIPIDDIDYIRNTP